MSPAVCSVVSATAHEVLDGLFSTLACAMVVVLPRSDWPWPSRSNLTSKSKFAAFWVCEFVRTINHHWLKSGFRSSYQPIMQADPCVSLNAPSLGSSGEPGHPQFDFDWHLAYMFSLVYFSVDVCLVGVFPHSVSTRRDPCVRVCAPLTLASPLTRKQKSNWLVGWIGFVSSLNKSNPTNQPTSSIFVFSWGGSQREGCTDPDTGISPCANRMGKHAYQKHIDGKIYQWKHIC